MTTERIVIGLPLDAQTVVALLRAINEAFPGARMLEGTGRPELVVEVDVGE